MPHGPLLLWASTPLVPSGNRETSRALSKSPSLRQQLNALERSCTSFCDRVVLIARTTAHADGANHLAIFLQRDAAGKDHDLAIIRGMDAEELPARLRVGGEIFGGDVESPRGVGLLDGLIAGKTALLTFPNRKRFPSCQD